MSARGCSGSRRSRSVQRFRRACISPGLKASPGCSTTSCRLQIGPPTTPAHRVGEGAVMRKQMIEDAVYEVATQVRAVEDSIDAALTEIAELQSRVMHVNSVARVGPATVHSALEQLAVSLNGLIGARGAIVACHT